MYKQFMADLCDWGKLEGKCKVAGRRFIGTSGLPALLESQPSWAVNIGSGLVRVEAVCGGGVLRMSCGGSSQASMASSSLLPMLEKLLASSRASGSWVLCRLGM